MQTYREYSPTSFDRARAFLPERQDWLVLPVGRNRDSSPLAESNFHTALALLGGESDTVEVHSFNHWACGWFEIILLHPSREAEGEEIEERLGNYPVLDENDLAERETEAANETWKACYSIPDRVEYIRRHRGQFEFHSLADMLGCVRGDHFAGYASDLLSR